MPPQPLHVLLPGPRSGLRCSKDGNRSAPTARATCAMAGSVTTSAFTGSSQDAKMRSPAGLRRNAPTQSKYKGRA